MEYTQNLSFGEAFEVAKCAIHVTCGKYAAWVSRHLEVKAFEMLQELGPGPGLEKWGAYADSLHRKHGVGSLFDVQSLDAEIPGTAGLTMGHYLVAPVHTWACTPSGEPIPDSEKWEPHV
jgi:hypothetical protein